MNSLQIVYTQVFITEFVVVLIPLTPLNHDMIFFAWRHKPITQSSVNWYEGTSFCIQ